MGLDVALKGVLCWAQVLGWTDVQREKSSGFMGGSDGPIKVVSSPLLSSQVHNACRRITFWHRYAR